MALLDFILNGHDIRLVLVAALVCLISSYACVGLLRHAHRAEGRMRLVWTVVSALAVGFGIWATHFVGMLAFKPGFTMTYDLGLTLTSLAIAIAICGAGIFMAVRGKGAADHFLGGAVVGIAISGMHYTGIAALVMGGSVMWDASLVALSIIAGILLGGAAFVCALGQGVRRLLGGATLLTLAICAMHFTAMGASDFSRCFPLTASEGLHAGWMATTLAFISVMILGAALGSAILDERNRRRSAREAARQLHDAERIAEATDRLELALTHMAQGLGLYDGTGRLQLYNDRLPQLLGLDPRIDLTGMHFREICRMTIIAHGAALGDIEPATAEVMVQHGPLLARVVNWCKPWAMARYCAFPIARSATGPGCLRSMTLPSASAAPQRSRIWPATMA